MDNVQLTKWKQLANDAVIATYGYDSRESRLAEALERATETLSEMSNDCDDSLDVDVNEVLRIHGELKKQVASLKDLHVKFAGAVAESDVDDLVEELASQVEEIEGYVDELEAEVIP